jgi:peroxiredoxin Q/BCP
MSLKIGSKIPNFVLPISGERTISTHDFLGKKLIIYFYPKDNTPGCTIEAKDFRDHKELFEAKNTKIIGISKDSINKHNKFTSKYDLNFDLASDRDDQVCEKFGVWVEKNIYITKYMGIERSTFLINEDGEIQNIWRKVKVKGHVEEVLSAI